MTDVDGIKFGLKMYQGGKEDAIKQVLEIIDKVEHTEGLSRSDEYELLRIKISGVKGGEQE